MTSPHAQGFFESLPLKYRLQISPETRQQHTDVFAAAKAIAKRQELDRQRYKTRYRNSRPPVYSTLQRQDHTGTVHQTTHHSANHALINENRHFKHMNRTIIINNAISVITLIVIRRLAHTIRVKAIISIGHPCHDPIPTIRQTTRVQIHKKSQQLGGTHLKNNVRHNRVTKHATIIKASAMRFMNVANDNTTMRAANKSREIRPIRRDDGIRSRRTTGNKFALWIWSRHRRPTKQARRAIESRC